jgi:hypothetical protein
MTASGPTPDAGPPVGVTTPRPDRAAPHRPVELVPAKPSGALEVRRPPCDHGTGTAT